MELVKLGKKGQVTIPKGILKQTGIPEDSPLLVEAAPDGSIVLRPAGVYPIEVYTDRRIKEFEDADRMTPGEEARVESVLKRKARKKR
ncbi:MAG: AbrB/MazE/SpoVT family DNA-binding domain-containing protein [Burkholderiales bacterium]